MAERLTWEEALRALSALSPKERVVAERRLGQYLVALGAGAGASRVAGSAVDILRARYLPPIAYTVATNPDAWKVESVHVLELVRGIGRLAASDALKNGSITITCCDVWGAADRVEEVTRTREARKVLNNTSNHVKCPPRPDWCLPVKPQKAKNGGKKR